MSRETYLKIVYKQVQIKKNFKDKTLKIKIFKLINFHNQEKKLHLQEIIYYD